MLILYIFLALILAFSLGIAIMVIYLDKKEKKNVVSDETTKKETEEMLKDYNLSKRVVNDIKEEQIDTFVDDDFENLNETSKFVARKNDEIASDNIEVLEDEII